MIRKRYLYAPPSSKYLEERLQKVVEDQDRIESEFRQTNQKYWTICFIDVSESAKKIYEMGENVANAVFANYQTMVREILNDYGACFIEPGGGPQIVCCFEKVVDAIDAMGAVINHLNVWNHDQDDVLRYMASIGVHVGYINYHDGLIHQSNTNNMAKRIQSKAKPGEIFISADVKESLKSSYRFHIVYVGEFELKNISEPQEIYQVKKIKKKERKKTELSTNQLAKSEINQLRKTYQWVVTYIDVCGSTKKFWSFGDREASELIKNYQRLCHQAFNLYQPTIVQSCEGDQIIACYEKKDAKNAAIAAIQIMKALFKRNVNISETKKVQAAIGLHFGEVIVEDDNLITTADMRVGKMIQSEANADEILLSHEVRRLLGCDFDHALEKYGEYEFDGQPKKFHLKQLHWYKVTTKPVLLTF